MDLKSGTNIVQVALNKPTTRSLDFYYTKIVNARSVALSQKINVNLILCIWTVILKTKTRVMLKRIVLIAVDYTKNIYEKPNTAYLILQWMLILRYKKGTFVP